MNRVLLLAATLFLIPLFSCGGTQNTSSSPASKLVGEWQGLNSTQSCVPASDPCFNIVFTVTFTADGTYSIVSSDGGADAGTFTATTSKITTVTDSIKLSTCFTEDFLANTSYTLSSDGLTLTIPVCPIILTKQ